MSLFQCNKYLLRTYQGAKCWSTKAKVKETMRYHATPTRTAKTRDAGNGNAGNTKC